MNEADLEAFIPKFKAGMNLQDRKYRFTTYPHCFLGTEAVTWIMDNAAIVKTRNMAVDIGNRIMKRNHFVHVVREHDFADKDYYYYLIYDGKPLLPAKNLYERLGGQRAIAAVVDDFINRIRSNPVVNANPIVKEIFQRSLPAGLKYSVAELICSVTGGPQVYTGRNMIQSHVGMKITEEEWNAFASDFKTSLDNFKVPTKEQNELLSIVISLKSDIVQDALYFRLGGVKGISTVVDDFVNRILVNEVLNKNPVLKKANETVSAPAFKYYVTEFVCAAAGGPQKYSGKNMKDTHKDMHISEEEWAAFAGDFKATLDKFSVPEREQNELFALVGTLKADIVTQPVAPKSLFDRLGGFYPIASVVDDFVDRVRTDYVLNSNPAIKEANAKSLPSGFKFLVTEIFCMATGGPQKYSGKSMKESHAMMKIGEREWQQFLALFKASADKFRVPVQETQEVIDIFNSLKGDIVAV